jgi:hypothetical protein
MTTPNPDNLDARLMAAKSPAEVLEVMRSATDAPRATEPVSQAPAYVAPPVPIPEPSPVRAAPPRYPSASTPAAGPYWGRGVEWEKATPGAGGGRVDEALAGRQGQEPWQAAPGQRDVPLETALEGAQSPAEVMALMRETQHLTGLGVEDRKAT